MAANSISSSSSIVPEILNHYNYKMWSSCMKDYLLGQDLWEVITAEAEAEPEEDGEAKAEGGEVGEAKAEAKETSTAEVTAKAKAESKAEVIAIAEAKVRAKAEAKAKAVAEVEAKAEVAAEAEPKAETKTEAEVEAKVAAEAVTTKPSAVGRAIAKAVEAMKKSRVEATEAKAETTTESEAAYDEDGSASASSPLSSKKIWRKKNALALHAIKMSCIPDFRTLITEVESAKKAWDLLRSKTISENSNGKAGEEDTADLVQEYDKFIKATKDRDWSAMQTFIDSHPQALSAKVFMARSTALHYALDRGYAEIAGRLVEAMTTEELEIGDENGLTCLDYGACAMYPGLSRLLAVMVEKNPKLPNIVTSSAIPVLRSCLKGYKDTTSYLYYATDKKLLSPEYGMLGLNLLCNCIFIKLFEIAIDLVKLYPKLLQVDNGVTYPIHILATTFATFSSGNGHKKSREEKMFEVSKDHNLIYKQAQAFLQLVCSEVSTYESKIYPKLVYSAMIRAAKWGTIEFISEMLAANPKFIHAYQDNNTMFWYAVENRQAKVFSLIYGAFDHKDSLLAATNVDMNNILHLAANLAPSHILDRTSGAVLQMQRDLQWFEEVWNVVKPRYREDLNKEGLTPGQLFTKSHKKLMEDGEKSMKDTAQSCTVVGALIVTIMFAGAFTVPGSNNQDTGLPIFLRKGLFKTFIICDALSLYSSTTSILVFLGILTTRYAEDDFLLRLPRKLMIGLTTLFFSITKLCC